MVCRTAGVIGLAGGAGGGAAAFPTIVIGNFGVMMAPEQVSINDSAALVPLATPIGPETLTVPALNGTGVPI
jgi:hypothetical protein